MVFAAASLAGALDEVAQAFEGEVTLSYAGSATLARQADAGAPADLVILANRAWMDHLAGRGTIRGEAVDVISNRLVLVLPSAATRTPVDGDPLAGLSRIATGFTEAVPLGIYTRQALQSLELWDRARPLLVETENARLALALVARGDVDAGFVYRSDAMADPRVRVAVHIAADTHGPIRYPAAITTRAQNPDAAQAFLDHLTEPAAQAIFAAHGYEPLP